MEGIRLAKEYLARAVADGTDLEARAMMMSAAAMGATAFQKGLGAMHSLSHPLGALYGTHHGMTNAVVMPYVLQFNRKAIEERIGRLAGYLGLPATFDAFYDWVMGLRAEIGVPHTLAELGLTQVDRKLVVAMAIVDPTAGSNPVELTAAAADMILGQALGG